MSKSLIFSVLVGAAVLAAVIVAIPRAPAQQAEPLVVYSGRSDQFVKPVADAFTARTGIPVVLHAGSSTELLNKMRLEGSRTEADLYLSNDAGTLQIGEDQRLFHELPLVMIEAVPANYRGSHNGWVGLSARARVLVVNAQAGGTDELRSVFDLARSGFEGGVGITSATNESFVAGLSVYQARVGDERAEAWLRGLRANVGREVYPRHGAVVADVAAGRRAVGLVNHYYVFRHLDRDPNAPIRVLVPDQHEGGIGVAINVAGIAISRHARNRSSAEAFVAFLVSEEGQRMFADANLEYPVRRGVDADPRLPAVESLKIADFPLAELGARRAAALDLIDKVGMQ